MAYQQAMVGVDVVGNELIILDPGDDAEIARHTLMSGTGHIVKNTDHYRDQSQRIADYEVRIGGLLGESSGRELCELIKQTSPHIYRDQLAGIAQILSGQTPIDPALIERLLERPRLTATQMKEYFDAYTRNPERLISGEDTFKPGNPELLIQYASLTNEIRGTAS